MKRTLERGLKRRAILIVEDHAELHSLTRALVEGRPRDGNVQPAGLK
jgi:hypothetical protein